MLGDNYFLNVGIGEENKELYFNYQTLKNLYKLTEQNPFNYLQDFMFAENKDEFLGTIIYCMANGDINLNDIEMILDDKDIKNNLLVNIINLITVEFKSEYTEEEKNNSEKEDNEQVEKTKEDKLKQFEDYWNYSYFTATVKLKKTEDEFYKMTHRELKTLDKFNSNYYKNILIDTYVTVLNAKNGSAQEEKEEIVNVTRFRDICT